MTRPLREFLANWNPIPAAIGRVTSRLHAVVDAINLIAEVGWRHSVFPEFVHQIDIMVRHLAWFDRNLKHAVGVIGVFGQMIMEAGRAAIVLVAARDAVRKLADILKETTV